MKKIAFHLRQLKEKVQYFLKFLYKRKLVFLRASHSHNAYIYLDNYHIKANPWGEFKIPSKYRHQFKTHINKNGWMFNTPSRNYGVIGYPSITFHNLPMRILDIELFNVLYAMNLEVEKYRKYNLSFDFWIGSKPSFQWPNIVHEVMVWEDYFVAMPFGKYKETIQLGGKDYRVYTGYIDKSSENLGIPGWQYTALLRVERTCANTIDVAQILRYLMAKDLINPEHYLLRSEIGNEVYNANGNLFIQNFHKHIQEKTNDPRQKT